MTKKKTAETLTQQFAAATVSSPTDSSPELTVVDDGEVDNDPTLVMSRREVEILCEVCGQARK